VRLESAEFRLGFEARVAFAANKVTETPHKTGEEESAEKEFEEGRNPPRQIRELFGRSTSSVGIHIHAHYFTPINPIMQIQ
jgi:hypothetical protein